MASISGTSFWHSAPSRTVPKFTFPAVLHSDHLFRGAVWLFLAAAFCGAVFFIGSHAVTAHEAGRTAFFLAIGLFAVGLADFMVKSIRR